MCSTLLTLGWLLPVSYVTDTCPLLAMYSLAAMITMFSHIDIPSLFCYNQVYSCYLVYHCYGAVGDAMEYHVLTDRLCVFMVVLTGRRGSVVCMLTGGAVCDVYAC